VWLTGASRLFLEMEGLGDAGSAEKLFGDAINNRAYIEFETYILQYTLYYRSDHLSLGVSQSKW